MPGFLEPRYVAGQKIFDEVLNGNACTNHQKPAGRKQCGQLYADLVQRNLETNDLDNHLKGSPESPKRPGFEFLSQSA